MALIKTDDVQAWFTDDRLSLELTDDLPEAVNVEAKVLAKCSTRYDVSTWVDFSTTPQLVKSVISAQVAAIRYRKHYADQLDELLYADWLDEWAMKCLEGIVSGTIPLIDIPADELLDAQLAAGASFYPDDSTTPGPKFQMDQVF